MSFHQRHSSIFVACLISAGVSFPVYAQTGHVHGDAHGIAGETAKAPLVTGQGVVKKVDRQNLRITLAHEAIPALNWPAMTMAFAVADQALLEGVKPGDKVSFELRDAMTLVRVMVVGEI
jgi:Cu(I)/Ag(I) efflux system protein CusF